MILVQEDLWAQPADLVVVTTNGVLNKARHLVMGKGAALEAAKRYPNLAVTAGAEILKGQYPSVPQFGELIYIYGFIGFPEMGVGLFQTKFHWRGTSDLELIEAACGLLKKFIKSHDIASARLNFPGINNGGLTREAVLPVISSLPDSVTVCYQ
jgi:hypothetical protein